MFFDNEEVSTSQVVSCLDRGMSFIANCHILPRKTPVMDFYAPIVKTTYSNFDEALSISQSLEEAIKLAFVNKYMMAIFPKDIVDGAAKASLKRLKEMVSQETVCLH